MNKKLLGLAALLLSLFAQAQPEAESGPEMADAFRENGKIYVVITVIAIIFIALAGFLFYLERKLKKAEEKLGK